MTRWGRGAAGMRMAVGTLTVVPVRVDRVDRAVARWAMLLAPVAGLLLALLCGTVLWALLRLGLVAPLAALLGLGLLAVLTRALHLDGLADLADGLGSARPADGALEVMRRSDIGPFGVLALLFAVGIQVAAVAQVAGAGAATAALGIALAVVTGRLALTWACREGVPSARPDGLGAMVAGTVPPAGAAAVSGGVLVLAVLAGMVAPVPVLAAPAAVLAGLAAAEGVRWHAVRRLGGVTGDVLGALCEIATTAALVVLAAAVAGTG